MVGDFAGVVFKNAVIVARRFLNCGKHVFAKAAIFHQKSYLDYRRSPAYDVIHIRVVPFYGEMSHQFLMTSGSLSYCPVASRPHS